MKQAGVKANKKDRVKKKPQTVPLYKLFCFATPLDYFLMLVGTLAAMTHGASFPVFFIFFARLIETMGTNLFDVQMQSHAVQMVSNKASSHSLHVAFKFCLS